MLHDPEIELLRALVQHQVRFIVVGGYAVIFHGHLRAAKDLDLFVDRAGDNPTAIIDALGSVGIVHSRLTAKWLSEPKRQLHGLGRTSLEILTSIAGVDFDEARADSVLTQVEGLQVRVLSLKHLIQSKHALGRQQDLEDLAALERLAESS